MLLSVAHSLAEVVSYRALHMYVPFQFITSALRVSMSYLIVFVISLALISIVIIVN